MTTLYKILIPCVGFALSCNFRAQSQLSLCHRKGGSDEIILKIMKKWQKILGVIAFGAIGIYELLLCANTYVDLKYIIEPYDITDIIDRMYLRADALSASLWINYFIALALFICLWRKGGKR